MTDERFWSLVEVKQQSECWLWLGEVNGSGRAAFRTGSGEKRRRVIAARHAWTLQRGSIPAGKCIGTKCWNYLCVNPWHHEIRTQSECIRVGVSEGKFAVGELNPMYKHGRYVGLRSTRATGRRAVKAMKGILCREKRPALARSIDHWQHRCGRYRDHFGPHRVTYIEAVIEWERDSLVEIQRKRWQ